MNQVTCPCCNTVFTVKVLQKGVVANEREARSGCATFVLIVAICLCFVIPPVGIILLLCAFGLYYVSNESTVCCPECGKMISTKLR